MEYISSRSRPSYLTSAAGLFVIPADFGYNNSLHTSDVQYNTGPISNYFYLTEIQELSRPLQWPRPYHAYGGAVRCERAITVAHVYLFHNIFSVVSLTFSFNDGGFSCVLKNLFSGRSLPSILSSPCFVIISCGSPSSSYAKSAVYSNSNLNFSYRIVSIHNKLCPICLC